MGTAWMRVCLMYHAHCSFGYGDCWFDHCWQWQDEYDWSYGQPTGPATMSEDGMLFYRKFTEGNVSVDCNKGTAQLNFPNSRSSQRT